MLRARKAARVSRQKSKSFERFVEPQTQRKVRNDMLAPCVNPNPLFGHPPATTNFDLDQIIKDEAAPLHAIYAANARLYAELYTA